MSAGTRPRWADALEAATRRASEAYRPVVEAYRGPGRLEVLPDLGGIVLQVITPELDPGDGTLCGLVNPANNANGEDAWVAFYVLDSGANESVNLPPATAPGDLALALSRMARTALEVLSGEAGR